MRILWTALAVAVCPAVALADDTPIMLRAYGWLSDVKGNVRADDDGVSGSNLDIDRILNTEENETAVGASLRFPLFWNLRLNADFWTEDFRGASTLTAPINYGGSVFTAGTRVLSEFEFDVATVTIEYDYMLPMSDDSAIGIAAMIGGRYIGFESTLKNTTALVPFRETEKFSIFLPTTGLRAEVRLTQWFTAELSGQWFSACDIEGRDVDTFEFQAGGTINFWRGMYVGAGYRYIDFDIKDRSKSGQRLDLDMELDGAYFELGYRF